MIKAVIFDIDGTLIDSNKAHAESFVEAFKKFGVTASYVKLKWMIGMGADKVLKEFLTKNEISEIGEDLTEYRKKIFLKKYLPKIEAFPKLRELFGKLDAESIRIALASSASDEELEKYKKLMRISKYLKEETTSDDAEESKPAPDIFQAAFQKLDDVEKENVLIVGDTPYDAAAAVKSKIKIVGVRSGGWSAERLKSAGCENVFENIAEMLAKFDEIFV